MNTTAADRNLSAGPAATAGVGRSSLFRRVVFGFLLWLIVFAAAMAMYPWRVGNRPLFESAIAVVLAAATVLLTTVYFRRTPNVRTRHGLVVGLVWAVMNIAIDLVAFSAGPMRMTPAEYFADIGVAYIMIPVLTSAMAHHRRVSEKAVR
jgi:hypothetical protein